MQQKGARRLRDRDRGRGVRGEGRSQLCGELAISFAQLGRRTLLVDADMRRPHQHVLFGASNQYGLSKAITTREAPYYNPVAGLTHMHLLTAGPVPPNPLELLSDGRFSDLFTTWRNALRIHRVRHASRIRVRGRPGRGNRRGAFVALEPCAAYDLQEHPAP